MKVVLVRLKRLKALKPVYLLDVVVSLRHCHRSPRFKAPAVVVVVNHVAGHTAVDADVLASDEARLVGGKVENHPYGNRRPHRSRGDRPADSFCGCVLSFVGF